MSAATIGIIGAGPAGVGAAIQLRRYGAMFTMIEGDAIGGLARNADRMENLPGFPDGLRGPEFAERLSAQLSAAGIEPLHETVTSVRWDGGFTLRIARQSVAVDTLVIASGTEPIPLEGVVMDPDGASRVHYGVHRLGDLENARVAIVGAGDAAFDYGLNLARRNQVILLNRSTRRRCLPLLWERCKAESRIRYEENTRVERVEESGQDLTLTLAGENGARHVEVDALLVAIGRRPRLGFLDAALLGQLDDLRERGALFLAGDVRGGRTRQASIAWADGIRAAMQIAACRGWGISCAS